MKAGLIIAGIVLALALIVAWSRPSEPTFDDRFEDAEAQLEALSKSIEQDLPEPRGNR
ncbi:MAG: hypothetical protein AAFP79_06575 [Pseudomonadota bacterium]